MIRARGLVKRYGAAAESALTRREMFTRTVRSEFTKIRSVRSTSWSLALMVLASAAWCAAVMPRRPVATPSRS